MVFSILGHTFGVEVTFGSGEDNPPHWTAEHPTKYIDTFRAVKKPLYYARFGTHLPDDAVQLAYAAVEEIEADDNVIIMDRSAAVRENSPEFASGEDQFNSSGYNSYYQNVLFTDVTTTPIQSQATAPLFYKHVLDPDIDTDTISVLDSNFQPINEYAYKIETAPVYDETTGDEIVPAEIEAVIVYNDLENHYDEDTGELVVYYVRYIEPGTTPQAKTVLLNNQPVFETATWSDIWSRTLRLKPWAKAYLVNATGTYYTFTMPETGTYYVRYEESARMSLFGPVTNSNDDPWFIRISNSSFIHNYLGSRYTYQIAEFRGQLFNPIYPYKLVAQEQVEKIVDGLVYLTHKPLALDDLVADIVIKDSDDSILHALTTDTTKVGDTYYDEGTATTKTWDGEKILSWDAESGLVHLDVLLLDTYKIYATYYYTEKYYELTAVNLNPLSNTVAKSGIYVIYVVPEAAANGNMGSQEISIHYLKVDRDGQITEASEDSGLVGKAYGRPGIEEDSFLYDYSVEAPTGETPEAGGVSKRYLILGELAVINRVTPEDVTVLDVRLNGGGIKEDYAEEVKQINPAATWHSDIGLGGLPYPAYGSVVVKLPYTILSDYGGDFEESEVLEIVKRHMAWGHYPLIRWYGVIPNLYIDTDSLDTANTIELYWNSEEDYTFNVYYGQKEDGPFTKHNSSAIANSESGNSYSVDGLSSGVIYWLYATAVDGDSVEGPRSVKLKVRAP